MMNQLSLRKRTISSVLKVIVAVAAVVGVLISAYASRDYFMGGSVVLMYFTNQSNIAMAIISLIGLFYVRSGKTTPKVWQIIKFVGTVSITLTGVVFCFLLAPTLGDRAWNLQNVLTHVVVPVVSIVDFFVVAPMLDIAKRQVGYVIIPPLLYAIYAGVGYVNNWQFSEGLNYPYFFLNWGSPVGAFGLSTEPPFMGTAWWIFTLFIFLILVGYCYLRIVDRIKARQGNA